MQIYPDVSYAF